MTKTQVDDFLWSQTPLIRSWYLSKSAGCQVYLKLENLQPSGSFKSRGIGNYIRRRIKERGHDANIHFYASSGGNAGLACVCAATSLGYPATVVVPTTAKPTIIAKLKAYGASDVVQHGDSVLDADRYLRETILKADPNGVYVPPFDHQDIWDGNATMMDEIASVIKPDVVVCSVGGGGLMNGVIQEIDRRGWQEEVEVVAMETFGAHSLNVSLAAGKLSTMDRITSQAKSLGVARVSQRTWDYAQRPQVKSWVVSDLEAAKGCYLLAEHEKILAELTVGVNITVCFEGLLNKILERQLKPTDKVVIVVCGGSDITVDMLTAWQDEYSVKGTVRRTSISV